MKKERKVVVYHDELNDDFAGVDRAPYVLPDEYEYLPEGFWWKLASFFVYRVAATPLALLYCKVAFRMRFVNDCTVMPKKEEGCFLFGNHTMMLADAFTPTLCLFPKRAYVVVSPENLSTPATRTAIRMLGALPRPNTISQFKSFSAAIEKAIGSGKCVTIYPEAHLWPYYTGIRPFPATSFRYAASSGAPCYVSVATYRKRKHGDRPNVTVYLAGPFRADPSLPVRLSEKALRDEIYETMSRYAKKSDYAYVEYRRAEDRSPSKAYVQMRLSNRKEKETKR